MRKYPATQGAAYDGAAYNFGGEVLKLTQTALVVGGDSLEVRHMDLGDADPRE
jgi:hypothetical protein